MNKTIITLLLSLLYISSIYGQTVLSISQTQISSWSDDAGSYSVWEAIITNRANDPIYDADIIPDPNTFNIRNLNDVWGLAVNYDNVFHLPTYTSDFGIAPLGTHKFGYINKGYHPAQWTFGNIQFQSTSRSN